MKIIKVAQLKKVLFTFCLLMSVGIIMSMNNHVDVSARDLWLKVKKEEVSSDMFFESRDPVINLKQIKELIRSDIDFDYKDREKKTLLMRACKEKNLESVRALVQAGAKIEYKWLDDAEDLYYFDPCISLDEEYGCDLKIVKYLETICYFNIYEYNAKQIMSRIESPQGARDLIRFVFCQAVSKLGKVNPEEFRQKEDVTFEQTIFYQLCQRAKIESVIVQGIQEAFGVDKKRFIKLFENKEYANMLNYIQRKSDIALPCVWRACLLLCDKDDLVKRVQFIGKASSDDLWEIKTQDGKKKLKQEVLLENAKFYCPKFLLYIS